MTIGIPGLTPAVSNRGKVSFVTPVILARPFHTKRRGGPRRGTGLSRLLLRLPFHLGKVSHVPVAGIGPRRRLEPPCRTACRSRAGRADHQRRRERGTGRRAPGHRNAADPFRPGAGLAEAAPGHHQPQPPVAGRGQLPGAPPEPPVVKQRRNPAGAERLPQCAPLRLRQASEAQGQRSLRVRRVPVCGPVVEPVHDVPPNDCAKASAETLSRKRRLSPSPAGETGGPASDLIPAGHDSRPHP